MNKGVVTVVYPVSDVAAAKEVFTRLMGAEPAYDDPYYVGWQVGDQNIGLDPHGASRGMTGATPFFEVDDIYGVVAALVEKGAAVVEDVRGVGGGLLVAIVTDADGNLIGLSQSPAE